MTTIVELVDCGPAATRHRVLWSDGIAELLDHPTFDEEAEEILQVLHAREGSAQCFQRVIAWRATGVRNVARAVDALDPAPSPAGIEAIWRATGLGGSVRRVVERSDNVSLADVIETLASFPDEITALERGRDLAWHHAVVWLASLVRNTGGWTCPACGADRKASNAARHWTRSSQCYWFSDRAGDDGWRRIDGAIRPDQWPDRAAQNLFKLHIAAAKRFGGTYNARFVRSNVPGVSVDELLTALHVVRAHRRRRTYREAAAILGTSSATDIAALAAGDLTPLSLLQPTGRVCAA